MSSRKIPRTGFNLFRNAHINIIIRHLVLMLSGFSVTDWKGNIFKSAEIFGINWRESFEQNLNIKSIRANLVHYVQFGSDVMSLF